MSAAASETAPGKGAVSEDIDKSAEAHADGTAKERHHLLPCAHCGALAKLAAMPRTGDLWWRVQCIDSRCGMSPWATHGEALAVAAWNRRAR